MDVIRSATNQLVNGPLRHKGKLRIGSKGNMRQQLIKAMHSSALGGQSGVLATYKRLRSLFYWPSMQTDIQRVVQECDTCQRNKIENIAPPGLLQPLLVPDHLWKHISMDFIEGLPKLEGKDIIMVVIDRFSNYVHFIPLLHPFNAARLLRSS